MRKHVIFLLLVPFILSSCGSASKLNRADRQWSYEVESAGVGTDGTYALRVWSYYRTPRMPMEVAKKNAVHATLFRGIPAGNGAVAQPAVVTEPMTSSDSLFFDNFFISEYQNYINSVASGSMRIVKTGRNEYKIGYVLSVAKDNLRAYLEEKGIIKALSSGF